MYMPTESLDDAIDRAKLQRATSPLTSGERARIVARVVSLDATFLALADQEGEGIAAFRARIARTLRRLAMALWQDSGQNA